MALDEILFKIDKGVAVLSLNRESRLNALTGKMYREISTLIRKIEKNDEIKVLIITGLGRGFCSGVDLSDVSDSLMNRITAIDENGRFERLQQLGAIALDFVSLDKPVICAINGVAVGGGLSLALLSDIRLASEDARFGAGWINIGLVPDIGASYFLPRIVGTSKAFELMLTADMIGAEEALRIGLVNIVVPPHQLMSKAMEIAEKFAAGPSIAIELTKRGLQRSLNNDLKSQLDYETYSQDLCRRTDDAKEGLQAFVDKRRAKFKGN